MEAFGLVLKRFVYPCWYNNMIPRHGRSVSELCLITAEVTDCIYNNHSCILRDLNQPRLQPHRSGEYANAIHSRGTALNNCWGL